MADGDLIYVPDETGGRLGRTIINHDPRNRAYPVRGAVFAEEAPIVSKTWWRRGVFDQRSESSCTAQAAAGVVTSSPFRRNLARTNLTSYDDAAERFELYREAQKLDPWPGESYDGSSTDAPYQVMRARGQIREFRWCFGIDDVKRTISHHGPVSIGVNWHEEMFETDGRGFIWPRGAMRGGHAVELIGYNVDRKRFTGMQSWGPWGIRNAGRFYIAESALEELLEAQGDACTVVL